MGPSYFPDFHEVQTKLIPNVLPIATISSQDDRSSEDRVCSVRGCSATLPAGYNLKMCGTCRGRHRRYATTKRAKRKAEKAAVVPPANDAEDMTEVTNSTSEFHEASNKDSTSPIRMTPSGQSTDQAGVQIASASPGLSTRLLVQESPRSSPEINYVSADDWDINNSNIDPRLFQTSSELAGALTYGSLSLANEEGPSVQESTLLTKSKSAAQSVSSYHHNSPSLSSVTSSRSTPRYCSIKGCKAVMSGDSFFKMCEDCRDRYRGYGITKRAKWKKERDEAHCEIERLRGQINDNTREVYSQSSELGYSSWKDDIQLPVEQENSPETSAAFDVKMCTVSHCRQILPANYEFRRCEQHRLQNRHHSKLKREREKDVKAQARNMWAEDACSGGVSESWQQSFPVKEREPTEPLFTTAPMDLKNRESKEKQNMENGVPPPARGSRRTNHVCSVKFCHNLLDPMVPWKMCETCRERDRLVRKNRAVRDAEGSAKFQSGGVPVFISLEIAQPARKLDVLVDLRTTSAPATDPLHSSMSADSSGGDIGVPASQPPSAPALTNGEASHHSANNSPNIMFEELMLPEMSDSMLPDMQAPQATYTSVFQASLAPAPAQPRPIRFAKPSSSSSTSPRRGSAEYLAHTPTPVPLHSGLLSDSSVTGILSDLSSSKRKYCKKRSSQKTQNKTVTIVDSISGSVQVQENQQMPTTVSPQSVEINPTQQSTSRLEPLSAPVPPTSFTFSQFSTTPYTSPYLPPLYYMPPPFPSYGSQQSQFSYPPTYTYGRPPHYPHQYSIPTPPPPYMSGSYRLPPYPYHYPYNPTSYPNSSGYIPPSYTPISYPPLQWSTTMTPQAPPPEYAGENDVTDSTVPSDSVEHPHKRKRADGDSSIPPSGSALAKEGVDMPLSEGSSNLADRTDRNEPFSSHGQVVSCSNTKTCNRPVKLNNSLCGRCKARLKRRQTKAKKRFKLEPKGS